MVLGGNKEIIERNARKYKYQNKRKLYKRNKSRQNKVLKKYKLCNVW